MVYHIPSISIYSLVPHIFLTPFMSCFPIVYESLPTNLNIPISWLPCVQRQSGQRALGREFVRHRNKGGAFSCWGRCTYEAKGRPGTWQGKGKGCGLRVVFVTSREGEQLLLGEAARRQTDAAFRCFGLLWQGLGVPLAPGCEGCCLGLSGRGCSSRTSFLKRWVRKRQDPKNSRTGITVKAPQCQRLALFHFLMLLR